MLRTTCQEGMEIRGGHMNQTGTSFTTCPCDVRRDEGMGMPDEGIVG